MRDGSTPALMPGYKDGKDWLFLPVRVDGVMRMRVYRFETLTDTVYDDYGPLVHDSVRITMFRGMEVRYGDFNGDGRNDFFGGTEFWLMSNDTGHTIAAMDSFRLGPIFGDVQDYDGDGYDDILGNGMIRWGDSAAPLSTYSKVAWSAFQYPARTIDGQFGRAGGHPFAFSINYQRSDNCKGDTTRGYEIEISRFARLLESDIVAHDTLIRIDTTFAVREVSKYISLYCIPELCEGCRFMPNEGIGEGITLPVFRYPRNGLLVMDAFGSGRIVITDTGVVRSTASYAGGGGIVSIGLGGVSGTILTGDHDLFGGLPRVSLGHFADSADTFLTERAILRTPDTLTFFRDYKDTFGIIDLNYEYITSFRFPDVTGDGKPEVAFLYRHRQQGVIMDVFDAFGALPTSGGGDPMIAAPALDLTLRDRRATWSGGTAPQYVIRVHDVQGRLLRTSTVQGHELPTTGIDLRGLSGNVFITVEGGGTKHTYPVQVE